MTPVGWTVIADWSACGPGGPSQPGTELGPGPTRRPGGPEFESALEPSLGREFNKAITEVNDDAEKEAAAKN